MPSAKESASKAQLEPPHNTYFSGNGVLDSTAHQESLNRLLRTNLIICNVTVWLMFVVAPVVMAFALLAMDELRYE